MQLANITLALGGNKGNTVPKYMVTPSEIAVLRLIHGEDAVFDIIPIDPAALDKSQRDEHDEIANRPRREEIARLHRTYGRRDPTSGDNLSQHVNHLFPGAAAPVFQTLVDLELPDVFYKAIGRLSPVVKKRDPLDHDGDGKKGGSLPWSTKTPGRERGQPAPGAAKRTRSEVMEDNNGDRHDKLVAEQEAEAARLKAQSNEPEDDGIEDMDGPSDIME